MLFLKCMLLLAAMGFVATAAGAVAYDIFLSFELTDLFGRRWRRPETDTGESSAQAMGSESGLPLASPPRGRGNSIPWRRPIRWRFAAKLVLLAALAAFLRASLIVVPDGTAAVRVSQISGVLPGTLYSGTHLIFPLTERVECYDVRDKLFFTGSTEGTREKHEALIVESKEGLEVGLGVTVRYRIDARKLDYIQANLPRPLDEQIVAPVATSVFRELAPNYNVREIFSSKREEFRDRAAKEITERLGGDAVLVKEVMLRKVDLPQEYAQGLEGLLLKEQQDDQTSIDAEIEAKRVKIAESQAEAAKVREVKRAEADAASRVIMAQAESDSMQYTLPLKQKQIEQSRLEAEARKEATIQNAEADAQAKVIDSKAEQQRQTLLAQAQADAKVIDGKAEQQREELLAETRKATTITKAEAEAEAKQISSKAELESDARLADAEANRTRVTAKAEAEQLEMQASALKTNPLLVEYTVAQRLSDKVQIILVPADGKYFFTNDVLQSAIGQNGIPLAHPLGNK
jgi:regulator of protease activity HflC (stomatin/prohibitin superfamily)